MSDNNWKWSNKGFKDISPEMWKRSYETWLIIKEMGLEILMTFYPDGHVTYGKGNGIHKDTDAENAVVRAAMDEWERRNSSLSLENV